MDKVQRDCVCNMLTDSSILNANISKLDQWHIWDWWVHIRLMYMYTEKQHSLWDVGSLYEA